MRQFSVGEVVTWIPDLFLRRETRGDYRIVATMPDRDGQHMYRIKPVRRIRTGRKRRRSCQIGWLFARTGSRAGVAPQRSRTGLQVA